MHKNGKSTIVPMCISIFLLTFSLQLLVPKDEMIIKKKNVLTEYNVQYMRTRHSENTTCQYSNIKLYLYTHRYAKHI